eukprot:scaffold772_cov339-Pavlova_lutheri.AAC.62
MSCLPIWHRRFELQKRILGKDGPMNKTRSSDPTSLEIIVGYAVFVNPHFEAHSEGPLFDPPPVF